MQMLLVSWKGTRFEVSGILRNVVDLALTKDASSNDATLVNRAKAILLIGAILKAVQPEEGDQERRELERLVAETAARKKTGKRTPSTVKTPTTSTFPANSTAPKA